MTIITKDRIAALGNINRWRGWTVRPYSVLEHTVIGVDAVRAHGMREDIQRQFLLHDLHESEICGDVPVPDKERYVNRAFHDACAAFDRSIGMSNDRFVRMGCQYLDHRMKLVEADLLLLKRPGVQVEPPNYNDPVQRTIRDLIIGNAYADGETIFWEQYKRLI